MASTTKIAALVVDLDGDISKLRNEMRTAVGVVKTTTDDIQARVNAMKSGFDSVVNPIKSITSLLGPLAVGFGTLLSINAFVGMVRGAADAAEKMHDLAAETGASVESLSALASIGKMTDTGIDTISGSMNKLTKNMAAANEEGRGAGAALKALGIDFASFKAMSPDQQMLTVANAMDQFSDGGGKSAAAMALMGKEGAKMIPFLKDVAAAGELNAKITKEQAAMADNFNDNMVRIKGSSEAWKKQISMSMLPVMDELSQAWFDSTSKSSGLNSSIKSLAADGTFTEWARMAVSASTYLLDVGQGLLTLFPMIGKAIAGMMAMGVTGFGAIYDAWIKFQHADLDGAWDALKSGASQVKSIAVDTGADIAKLWNQELLGEKIRKGMKDVSDARTKLAEDPKAKVKFAAATEGNDATDAKEKVSEYEKLIRVINEKITVQELEAQGIRVLSDGDKIAAKFVTDLRDNKLKLIATSSMTVEAQKIELAAQIEKLVADEKAGIAAKKATEEHQKFIDGLSGGVDKLRDQVRQQQELNERIGLTREALAALDARELEHQATSKESIANTMDLMDWTGKLGDTYRAQAKELRELASLKVSGASMQDAFDKSSKELADLSAESKKFTDSLYNGLSDSLYRGFESGKGFFKSFWDGVKNLFKTTVLKFTVQGVMSGVTGAFAEGVAGSAAGGGSGMFSSGMSMLSAGKTLWQGFSAAGGGMLASAGSSITSAGSAMGITSMSQFGSGMTAGTGAFLGQGATVAGSATGTGALASGAGAAGVSSVSWIPIAGWIAAGMMTAANLKSQGWDANNGTLSNFGKTAAGANMAVDKGLRSLGMSDTLANIFSGQSTLARLFGRKAPEVREFGIEGNVGASGFSGGTYQKITEKGGWFRSDKNYTNRGALNTDTQAMFDESTKAIIAASKGFGAALGVDASVIDGYSKQIKLAFSSDEKANQEQVTKLFGGIADELSLRLVPSLASMSKNGESSSQTLQRLSGDLTATNLTMKALGLSTYAVSINGAKGAEGLIDLFGGLQSLQSASSSYYDNFYSDAEKLKLNTSLVSDAFKDAGQVMPGTREALRAMVEAARTAGDDKTYASLVKLSSAFASIVPASTAAEEAASKLASVISERKTLQDQYDSLTMTSVQLLERQKSALNDSNKSLFDQVQAATSARAAQDALAAATAAMAQRVAGAMSSLGDARTSLEAQLMTENGDLAGAAALTRKSDLDKLTGGMSVSDAAKLTAQYDYNESLKTQIKTLQDSKAAAIAAAQAQTQAAQAQIQAAQQLSAAWQSVTDSILGEVSRLRGATIGSGKEAFAASQAKFAITTAQARAGDQDAAKLLTPLSVTLDKFAEHSFSTLKELNSFRALTAASLAETANGFTKYGVKIPGFASGGDFAGGLRLVGEDGPEIEATGASRIFNASQTRSMLGGSNDALVNSLIKEVSELKKVIERLVTPTIETEKHTRKMKENIQRVTLDGEGMRSERAPA